MKMRYIPPIFPQKDLIKDLHAIFKYPFQEVGEKYMEIEEGEGITNHLICVLL